MASKMCIKCGQDKPLTAFTKNKNREDGTDNECKRCRYDRENSPEGIEARRDRDLWRRYGITLGDYKAMERSQHGLCGLCYQPEKRTNRFGETQPLSVDHDHKSGRVRGLLCANCNKGLGSLGDTLDSLYKAYLYLVRKAFR